MLIEHGRGKNVALVGHFPFIPKLRPAVAQMWIIEQHPTESEFPTDASADLIPQADVVAITSSALINHTLDRLLGLCRPDALVMSLQCCLPTEKVSSLDREWWTNPVYYAPSVKEQASSKWKAFSC